MLRDAALAWIRANVSDQRFHQDFERHFDQATEERSNCFLALGPGLARNGKPHLIHCFCGELFVFEMSPLQALKYKLTPWQVMWGISKRADQNNPIAEPVIAISNLEIEQSDNLPVDQPIIANISYDTNGVQLGPCVFRLDYEVPPLRSTVGWHYVDQRIPARGRIRCQFAPVKKPNLEMQESGPLAMFLRLCTLPDPLSVENRQPISNSAAELVTLAQ
jgi:hypothetical protein